MSDARRVIRAGLIGSSIQASRTPTMQMREGAAQSLDYSYEIFDFDTMPGGPASLPSLLDRLQAEGYVGVNVTHPAKQHVIDLIDDLSPDARAIGAVNTVIFETGKRVGRNTDWWGFAEAFRRGLPTVPLDRVMQLGAGGAGAAISYALGQLGAKEVRIYDLDEQRAQTLADRMNQSSETTRFEASVDLGGDFVACNGLVHCTPMGMTKYPGIALDPDLISPNHWVSEIVYVPLETELLRVARGKGCQVLDGAGMAVFQAVGAFEYFTGLPANPDRMQSYFNAFELA